MRTFYQVLSRFNLPVHKQALFSNDVPKKIINKYQNTFPEGSETQWYTRLGVFIAQFYVQGKYYQVFFTRTGKIARQYTKMKMDDIPEEVLERILGTEPAHTIMESLINELDDGPKYRLSFIRGKEQLENEFDAEGNVYKSSKIR